MSPSRVHLRPRRRPGWRHPVVQFVAAGLVTLIGLIIASGWLSERAATDEAIAGAQTTTELLADSVVEPGMPVELLEGQAAAVDRFDRLVRGRVLVGDVLRVKIWAPDGRIVYSDEPRLIGETFELGEDELEVLRDDGTDAEASDLDEPENRYEREFGRLLEVYTRIDAPARGGPLLFEAYYSYDDVTYRSTEVLDAFRPITVGGLLVFLVLTVPLVWVLARRLDTAAADRERLLLAAVESSDAERRRIARDLHDGVVQDLAGTSFALSATARDVADRPETARRLDALGTGVRIALRSLRSLLVEIYPPDLRTEGLGAALDDLVAPANAAGIAVDLSVADTRQLRDEVVALLWRAAQETVRNAVRHAHPQHLRVHLMTSAGSVVLEVVDDGLGFDPDDAPRRGHLGLRALGDLVRDSGGTMSVTSAPGQGTHVRVEVPR